MGTSHLKSTPITNLDATPAVANSAGLGGPARLHSLSGFVTAVAADAAGSTYQLVRVPSTAVIKQVLFESEAQGAGKVQLSVYYSDSTVDGTAPANQGLVVPTTGAGFFSDDIDCTSVVAQQDKTSSGTSGTGANGYTLDKRNKHLWDALGLTSDPGGFFDIVAVVHTTAVTTGTGRLGVCVNFTS
jgi:hypothetical protein